MMNIHNWLPYLKFDDEGKIRCMAQQTYEPLISPDGKTFCANYDWQNKYQRQEHDRPLYTKEIVDYFFNKEVEYVTKYINKPYAPEIVDIDTIQKRIYFKWYKESCNEIIYSGRQLNSDWKQQIRHIIVDLYTSGTFKLTMYPHCHYFDNNGQMRAIDWYGCVPVTDPYIESLYMDAIIHNTAQFRLDETGDKVNSKYNLAEMFKGSLGTHVRWGQETMRYIYGEIFNG